MCWADCQKAPPSAPNSIDPWIWQALDREHPQDDNLHCRRAFPSIPEEIYCGVDAEKNRYVLVPIGFGEFVEESDGDGLRAEVRTVWQEERLERFIAIRCEDQKKHAFFDLFAAALADELRSPESPSSIVRRELARWRRFWSDLPSPLLTREEQLGLFAELWFLHVWLYPRIGAVRAVQRWRGPFAARHDFEWPGRAVEVKGTTSQQGRIHHINGLDQLKVVENGRLFLFSIRLRETGSSHNSLPVLIELCRQPIANDPDALSAFENALGRFGYSSSHDATYAGLTLEVSGELLFEVVEGFPRLTSDAVAAAALAGIEHVEYDLNLSAYENLAIREELAINEFLS